MNDEFRNWHGGRNEPENTQVLIPQKPSFLHQLLVSDSPRLTLVTILISVSPFFMLIMKYQYAIGFSRGYRPILLEGGDAFGVGWLGLSITTSVLLIRFASDLVKSNRFPLKLIHLFVTVLYFSAIYTLSTFGVSIISVSLSLLFLFLYTEIHMNILRWAFTRDN